MTELNKDTELFLSRFYCPRLTTYVFLKVFFAILFQKGVTEVTRDFSEFIYEKKQDSKYSSLLRDVVFKFNGVFHYSNDIEDSVFALQNVGLLGKRNPSFGIILINYTEEIAGNVINSVEEDDCSLIRELVDSFDSINS